VVLRDSNGNHCGSWALINDNPRASADERERIG
jgi:hypothetical protein